VTKLLRCYLTWLCILCGSLKLVAQDAIQTRQYPKDFFSYPLDLPPSTAGSFGELRSNHFHSGLDFKTNHRTGYPLHAVYDGYISRLRVQFGGFGNAVYITHPNGYVSVYGHLERFAPALAKMVHDYQYQQQSFEVDINIAPMLMPVKKGEVVAWSGNAGASAGPHLHFELRDAQTQETINPQLFGLTIPDKIQPFISAMYVYHLNGNPFSELTAKEYHAVTGLAGNYRLLKDQVITLSGETGFGIVASDMNSTSPNRNGVYSIQLNVDDKAVYTFAVERFAFDETHAINAHIDFPAYLISGIEIQKSFILPGNKISVYPQSVNRGIVNFNDDALHSVEYIVKDVMGNTSTLKFKVKANAAKVGTVNVKPPGTLFKYDQKNEFTTNQVKVVIAQGNLYDDLNFNYQLLPRKPGFYSAIHRIHNRYTPLHEGFDLWIKADSTLKKYTSKAVIVSTGGASQGGEFESGYVKAHLRAFGDYGIKVDTIAPVIYPLNLTEGKHLETAKAIYFKAHDNLSGIKTYQGKIDGKWVLVEWDYKTKIFSFKFDETIKPGKHTFSFAVADYKDNLAQYTATFYR
jgi:hypothetical protein